MEKKIIFTFWEPKGNLPAYLHLCMKTWKKFLPEYEIVILDYSNLDEWLGKNYFDDYLYKHFSLPKQADAIRCALLKKYGGIWLDTDTILTSAKVRDILNIESDFVLINKHIAFIVAKKESRVLKKWDKAIKKNIKKHKLFYKLKKYIPANIISKYSLIEHFEVWSFLGNSAVRKSLKTKNKNIFTSISKNKIKALPEHAWMIENNKIINQNQNYVNFYFNSDYSDYALKDNLGIICLHNSWTPEKFKTMNEKEFLSQNITLSNIFKQIGL
jgi:mannosyltransferase OCH1-like enzyme